MITPTSPPVATSRRARRSIRNVTIALIATCPLAACDSDAADGPSPTTAPAGRTAPTTDRPRITRATTSIEATTTLERGTATGFFAGAEEVPVTFTLPAGWTNNGWGVIKGDPIYGLIFMNVDNIYTDSCPSVQVDPPVGPTVNDLAAAWSNLPGFHATEPIDVTVDGYHGKQIEFTVPDYDEADCTDGMFRLLREVGSDGDYWAQGPRQRNELRILDVDGTRLVIGAGYFPDTSAEDRTELDEILNSIQIG